MKGWVNLEATQWFWTRDPGLGIERRNHYAIASILQVSVWSNTITTYYECPEVQDL